MYFVCSQLPDCWFTAKDVGLLVQVNEGKLLLKWVEETDEALMRLLRLCLSPKTTFPC